ncbi:MAG: RNA methyltransferase [Clostridiaceae bacterium]|nr:RNA methyltransferase [Clostridiaceae bacterium]
MYKVITSSSNKLYKHIKSLSIKSNRDKNGEFIIEGIHLVEDALKARAPVRSIVVSESFIKKEEHKNVLGALLDLKLPIYQFPDRLFKEAAQTETPQGILGIVSVQSIVVEDILLRDKGSPLLIFCDSVQDPGNVGTIIRTADAAGADGVILSKGCVDVYNPKTVRSTMGSLFHIPIVKVEDSIKTLEYLKQRGIRIISSELGSRMYYFEVNMEEGVVIVIGNEAKGVSKEVSGMADYHVKIPMCGGAESLNAGIASGILIYEAVRQRLGKNLSVK